MDSASEGEKDKIMEKIRFTDLEARVSSSTRTSSSGITHYVDMKPPGITTGMELVRDSGLEGELMGDAVDDCKKEEQAVSAFVVSITEFSRRICHGTQLYYIL